MKMHLQTVWIQSSAHVPSPTLSVLCLISCLKAHSALSNVCSGVSPALVLSFCDGHNASTAA